MEDFGVNYDSRVGVEFGIDKYKSQYVTFRHERDQYVIPPIIEEA